MDVVALDLGSPAGVTSHRSAASPWAIRVVSVLRVAIALMIVANLARLPVLSSGKKDAPILFNDLLVFAVLAAGLLATLRVRKLVVDGPAAVALLFASVGGLSALLAVPRFDLSGFQFAFSIAYLLRWLAYFGIYWICINHLRREDVPSVWGTLEGAVLVFAGFGIVQSLFLPGFAQMVYPDSEAYVDWDVQGHRLVSSFLDPNFAGAFIVIGLLVLIARLSFGAPAAHWKLLLLFTALLLTVSRSSVLAFLVGALVIVVGRGVSRRLLRFVGLISVLLVPFIPLLVDYAASFNKFSIDGSAMLRVVSWLRAIEIFADNFVLGVGFNTYGFVQSAYGYSAGGRASFTLDGGLLFIAVMTGIVGVTLYSTMLAWIILRCRRVWIDASAVAEDRALCLGTAAATVALVVHSIFLNSLLLPYLMETMWVLWAMTFLVGRASVEGRHEQHDAPPDLTARVPVLVALSAAH